MVKGAIDYQSLNEISRQILEELQADFIAKDFSSDMLEHEYVGVALASLTEKYCNDLGVTKVDFDIALEELDNNGLIKTGPDGSI